ncbi:MAG: hypothetical protein ACLT8E_11030 [Akkermansia sp.]
MGRTKLQGVQGHERGERLYKGTRTAPCSSAFTAPASRTAPSDEHLERLEEARRRDHRKLGRELGSSALTRPWARA